jgi:hypothetical protein
MDGCVIISNMNRNGLVSTYKISMDLRGTVTREKRKGMLALAQKVSEELRWEVSRGAQHTVLGAQSAARALWL